MGKNIVVCLDGTWNYSGPNRRWQAGRHQRLQAVQELGRQRRAVAVLRRWGRCLRHADRQAGRCRDRRRPVRQDQRWLREDRPQLSARRPDLHLRLQPGAYTAAAWPEWSRSAACPTPTGSPTRRPRRVHRLPTRTNRQPLLAALQANYGNGIGGAGGNVEIACVGVWDTVGSLGIPGDLFQGLNTQIYGFLDTSLHPDVKAAFHAISIDERRFEFPATLWDPPPAPGQTIEQVWFAGNHGDVGGGWPETGLSDLTLGWMMARAQARGLLIDPTVFQTYTTLDPKHALDQAHDAWSPLWGFPTNRTPPAGSVFSPTVAVRWNNDTSYRPTNLPPGFPGA